MDIKTLDATTYADIDSGTTLLSVPWQIIDADGVTVLLEGNQSFALDTTVDDIKAFLSQRLSVYQEDAARHAEAAPVQVQLDNAAEVASAISNISLNS